MRAPSSLHLLWRLFRCARGTSILEFALLAPVFLTMLFGLIEYSRYAWAYQTLEEVAFNTARCISVGAGCETEDNQQQHAIKRARDYGVVITEEDVTIREDMSCKGHAHANIVRINTGFQSSVSGLIPYFPQSMMTEVCVPMME